MDNNVKKEKQSLKNIYITFQSDGNVQDITGKSNLWIRICFLSTYTIEHRQQTDW